MVGVGWERVRWGWLGLGEIGSDEFGFWVVWDWVKWVWLGLEGKGSGGFGGAWVK